MRSAGALCILLAACGESGGGDGGTVDARSEPAPAIDLLFVIDDSNTMSDEQQQLIAAFPAFLAELERAAGGRPSLHVGVVSSNMGTGPHVVAGCTEPDAGRLLATPRLPGCLPPEDPFLADEVDGGARVTNYPGTLEEAFGCIAALGNAGCGFEQHLAAMQAALDGTHPENAGFLREGSLLAVVVLADEDDCTASDPALFNPEMSGLTTPLGPFTSFRCTEFGVECNGLPVRREAASYTSCKPHGSSAYMPHPRVHADFLRTLKAEEDLAVAVIAGAPEPFTVALSMGDGNPELQPSCTAGTGASVPAVRLRGFTQELGARGMLASICQDDLAPAMRDVAGFLAGAVSAR